MLTKDRDMLSHSTKTAVPEIGSALRRQANNYVFEQRFCWVLVAVIFAVAALVCLVALTMVHFR